MGILWSLIIGCIAGLLAGMLMRDRSFGILWNTILGLVGGVVGGWVFTLLGITTTGWWGQLICAIIGACILLLIASFFNKKK